MPLRSLARRIGLGLAVMAAGLAALLARPHAALAHHVAVDDQASCSGWTASAEYIGGDEDRMVVVDVMINAEHIAQTFLFDEAHLGHQDYWLLYERTGTGSLQTSGTVTMYERGRSGGYTRLAQTDYTGVDLVCASPTATPTRTATATSTPPATNTPIATSTSTPTPQDTVETGGSVTPIPTETPTPETSVEATITPLATETSTPSAQGSTTPLATNTPSRDGNTRTATSTAIVATPTFTDEVRGSTPPEQPSGPDSPSGANSGNPPETGARLPNAGDGMDGVSFVVAAMGFALVILGVATIVGGRAVRSRK